MRIAVLSDPNNFHTQKWAKALHRGGAEVVVMSYEQSWRSDLEAIQLTPPIGDDESYSYLDYLYGGKELRRALTTHRIDVLNPLNITPFGVWAMKSGFHPVAACAFGADILEYPPSRSASAAAMGRSWDAVETKPNFVHRWRDRAKHEFYRKKVARALAHADFVTGDNQYLVDCMRDWFSVPMEKLEVLRWGIEPELFAVSANQLEEIRAKFGITAGQKVVLSPRGAKPIYQADIILEAFSRLLGQGREDTVFILLGAGYPVSPQVSKQAEILSESYRNFHFVPGVLPREEVHALWNVVDVFVSAPVYDGYSAALAEGRYMQAIPVVNDIPANREFIVHGENGWLCTPFTADKLAQDLTHLLDNTAQYRERFGPANRAWVLQHSLVDVNARQFLEILAKRFF